MTPGLSRTPALAGQYATSAWRHLAIVVAGICIITLGAKVQTPFVPVPMTLQTLAIMVVFAASGMRLSLEIILGYLALGLAGLPVFAGPVAGALYFAGPTTGFLAGFVVAAVVIGGAADRGLAARPLPMFASLVVGEAIIFALGFLWLGFIFTTSAGNTLGAEYAFSKGVQPFLVADLVKVVLAVVLFSVLSRRAK